MKSRMGQLKDLLSLGEEVLKSDYVKPSPGVIMLDYISGGTYNLWMNKIKIFANKYCTEHALYNDIIQAYNSRSNSLGTSAYDNMMGYLKALLEDNDFSVLNKDESKNTNSIMLFISHSEIDFDYVKELVDLLEIIGFKSNSLLFCSSLSGYRIPTDKNIYDYLKTKLNSELHVIMLLSDNYYNSPACLNEMGATWVKSHTYTSILTPEFKYSDIKGAIDPYKVSFKLDDKERLNEYKDLLIECFELEDIDCNLWERKRDEYLINISKINEEYKLRIAPQQVLVEEVLPCGHNFGNEHDDFMLYLRFINKSEKTYRCKSIDIKLLDKSNTEISFNIGYETLENIRIYGDENRRVDITVNGGDINGFETFNLNTFKRGEAVANWTTI